MNVFISIARDYSEYDFAVYTGTRTRTIKTAKDEFKLSNGDIFGYRDGRADSVYIVIQSAGLKKEFRIDGSVFDSKIAERADAVTRSKAKIAFEKAPKVTLRPKAPIVNQPGIPEPEKTPTVPRPPAGTEIPKPKVQPPNSDKEQAEQEAEESKLVHAYGDSLAWKRVKSKPGMIAYALAVFNKLNAKHGRDLVAPKFEIMKDMGANFKRRGAWFANQRTIKLSPRIFNGKQESALTVIVHEIAHQCVSEIDKVYDRTAQGHGWNWQNWMRKFGLTPSRYDTQDKEEYMTDYEKAKHNIIKDRHEAFKQQYVPLSPSELSENTVAVMFDTRTGNYTPGILVCKNDKAGKRWAFVHSLTGSWIVTPPSILYKATQDQVDKFKENAQEWLRRVMQVKIDTELRSIIRSNKRRQNRG